MKKTDLINLVSEKTDLSKKDTTTVVNCIFEEITASLKKEEDVDIAGFGKFKVNKKAARTGINPLTGKKIEIKACKAPAFKASKTLKEAIQ